MYAQLTARQESEISYHRDYAQKHDGLRRTRVALDVVQSPRRRPWNAYWCLYDEILKFAPVLRGKRIFVPGCGFGEDCIRLSHLGAEVHGTDLSADVIDVARTRAANFAAAPVKLDVMPCESLAYPDDYFDAVVFVNILHHVDIPRTIAETWRVTKPGARIFGIEMYTHSAVQQIRRMEFVEKVLYPRLRRAIYGANTPYITPDERKIDQKELDFITKDLDKRKTAFFHILSERVFSSDILPATRLDQTICELLGPAGRLLAARVLFSGTLT
ncbi:MAG: class I SAM-dependent methyltransferase [Rhodospirillaceae bacterium]